MNVLHRYRSTGAIAVALALQACSTGTAIPVANVANSGKMHTDRVHATATGSVYVISGDAVNVYAPGQTSISASIRDVVSPRKLAFSRDGTLAIASDKAPRRPAEVFLYKAGEKTSYAKIVLPHFDSFSALRFDRKGELFVGSPTSIEVYHLGDLTKPVRTVTADGSLKYAIAFDASNDFVTASNKGVSFYKLGATAPHANVVGFLASDAVYDVNGYLAVSQIHVGTVAIFAPEQTSPTDTLSQGIYNPSPLAVDAENHLYVGNMNPDSRSVSVFNASSPSPIYRIRSGTPDPRLLALGANGDLYVANGGTGGITEYKAGQTTPHLKIDIKADDMAIAP